jgi:hypothetical protein
VRLGVLDRRWMSPLARSKEVRGWDGVFGDRGVTLDEATTCIGLGAIGRSETDAESSIAVSV